MAAVRPGAGFAELELRPARSRARSSRRARPRRRSVTHFEVAEPSLEAVFIEHVGHPAGDDATLDEEDDDRKTSTGGRGLMARRDPLLPNAAIVARREYRDRVRSPLFLVSTLILMGLALVVALAPIAIRYLDQQKVDRIVVVADEDALAVATIATANGIMNIPPVGRRPGHMGPPRSRSSARPTSTPPNGTGACPDRRDPDVTRAADGRLDVTFLSSGPVDGVRSQLAGFTALSVGIIDWTSSLPPGSSSALSRPPTSAPSRSARRSKVGRRSTLSRSRAGASSGRCSSS